MKIVLSSASHHAMLFVYIVKEVTDAFGEDGKETIVKAVRRYGRQRGRRMAMRARIDENPCNALYYDMYGEWECFPGQVECEAAVDAGVFSLHYTRCPWYTEWKHFGMMEYGRLYCDYVDAAIMEGFGLTDGKLTGSRADGQLTCDLTFSPENKTGPGRPDKTACSLPPGEDSETGQADKAAYFSPSGGSSETELSNKAEYSRQPGWDNEPSGYTEAAFQAMEQERQKLGSQAKMPWEYHVGHLYQCLKKCVASRFGMAGEAVLARALTRYGEQFGEAALKLVLEYADLDYETLPAYKSYKLEGEDDGE